MKKFFARLSNQNAVVFDTEANLSKIDFYKIPSIEHSHEFNADLKLEQDEWYFVSINNEQNSEMLSKYFDSTDTTTDVNRITNENFQNIESLFLIDENKVIFTKITKSYFIKERWLLDFRDEGVRVYEQDDSIEFSGMIDAFYN
jgi:hypothetical protein